MCVYTTTYTYCLESIPNIDCYRVGQFPKFGASSVSSDGSNPESKVPNP